MLRYLPLLVVFALCLPVALAQVSPRVDLFVTRVALALFGSHVAADRPRRSRQLSRMRAAHVGGTHRAYAARTLFVSALFGLTGSVVGVYLAGGALYALSIPADVLRERLPGPLSALADLTRLPELGLAELFVVLVAASATVGTVLALGTYWARWRHLDSRATARSGAIGATLPRTIAFLYALSRSGMPFPLVLETLTRNRHIYGEAAREIGVAVHDMNAFGTDMLTALREMSARTPNEDLKAFGENLTSVLASGRSLSSFLREQHERYLEEAEARQAQYLELLSALAETYVTVLVAGPLFLITILAVVGLVIQDTLSTLRIIAYVAIPTASVLFVLYVDDLMGSSQSPARHAHGGGDRDAIDVRLQGTRTRGHASGARSDGGTVEELWRVNDERLAAYDQFRAVRRWIDRPVESLLDRPTATLLVTVPIGLAWVALHGTPARAYLTGIFSTSTGTVPTLFDALAAIDGPLVEATILVLGGVALVYEIRKRRTRAIDRATPDFFDRMASVNEAGLTVVESIERVAGSDLGALGPEIERTHRDVVWGASVETALRRLAGRTRTTTVSRAVTLITNAMTASGDISPVLRIAADEAQADRRLRRARRQEMVVYLLVIYLSFLVFLGIVVSLTVAFLPAIEEAGSQLAATGASASTVGVLSGIQNIDADAYELLFFHVVVIQSICSGLIAGQLGEGSVADGLKHATILLVLAHVIFIFL